MTRMTGPDCVVMCNLINTHTHTLELLLQEVLFSMLYRVFRIWVDTLSHETQRKKTLMI